MTAHQDESRLVRQAAFFLSDCSVRWREESPLESRGRGEAAGMWVLMRGARVLRSKAWGCSANARQLPHQDRSHLVIQVAFFLPAVLWALVVPSCARHPRTIRRNRCPPAGQSPALPRSGVSHPFRKSACIPGGESSIIRLPIFGLLAQLVEQLTLNQ